MGTAFDREIVVIRASSRGCDHKMLFSTKSIVEKFFKKFIEFPGGKNGLFEWDSR